MVRCKGPAIARDASGSLAETLTFSKWKGVSYLKQHRKPKQPRTPAQISMRVMLNFLSNRWNAIAQADKATWDALAAAGNVSAFNAYQGHNLTRWRNFQMPTQAYPAAETGTHITVSGATFTGHVRSIVIRLNVTNCRDNWCLLWHLLSNPADLGTWDNVRIAHVPCAAGWTQVRISPLDPGTYYVRLTRGTTTGKGPVTGGASPAMVVT